MVDSDKEMNDEDRSRETIESPAPESERALPVAIIPPAPKMPGEREITLIDVYDRATEMVEMAEQNRGTLNELTTRVMQLEANYQIMSAHLTGGDVRFAGVLDEMREMFRTALSVHASTTQQLQTIRGDTSELRSDTEKLSRFIQRHEDEIRAIESELQKLRDFDQKLLLQIQLRKESKP